MSSSEIWHSSFLQYIINPHTFFTKSCFAGSTGKCHISECHKKDEVFTGTGNTTQGIQSDFLLKLTHCFRWKSLLSCDIKALSAQSQQACVLEKWKGKKSSIIAETTAQLQSQCKATQHQTSQPTSKAKIQRIKVWELWAQSIHSLCFVLNMTVIGFNAKWLQDITNGSFRDFRGH